MCVEEQSNAFPANFSIAKAQCSDQGVFEVKASGIRCRRKLCLDFTKQASKSPACRSTINLLTKGAISGMLAESTKRSGFERSGFEGSGFERYENKLRWSA